MIALVGDQMRLVDFKEAPTTLLKFSLNFQGDLEPNRITNEISKVFKIEQSASKSGIVYDKS